MRPAAVSGVLGMTDEEIEARVEADAQRVAALARISLRKWYGGAEELGMDDLRIDTFMVLGIPVWDAEHEGERAEREDCFVVCESRKFHVKLGILQAATRRQMTS